MNPQIEAALADGVMPAEIRTVRAERTVLPIEAPERWAHGQPLRAVRAESRGQDATAVPFAVDPGSIAVRGAASFAIDPEWGTLGGGAGEAIEVDYRYSLLRLDSVVRVDGQVRVVTGRSHLTAPRPPQLSAGAELLANVLVPYFSDGGTYEIFVPSEPAPVQASQLQFLPRTAQKLRAGEPLRIVTWGDSVTEGGDSSTTWSAYPSVLERLLPPHVSVTPVAYGGSRSTDWLDGDSPTCAWSAIEAAMPDLVTVEFVNDAGLSEWEPAYEEIRSRVDALGAELLLMTPPPTMPAMMGVQSVREPDPRPYVAFLRQYAGTHAIALADISARFEHLRFEGIPYTTLLANGINHPDDRGHELMAQVLAQSLLP